MDAAITTSSGLGTPLYMAPEQIRGERLTPRTDIYALGIVLFELLTGARPFIGDIGVPAEVGENTSDRIRYQQMYVAPPDPRSLNPQIPEALAQVVLTALAKDPNQRYTSVQVMANAIGAAVAARFETLPNRVRVPDELFRPDAGWQPEPPPDENAVFDPNAPPEDHVAAGSVAAYPPGDWQPAPEHGDTLPGRPPAPRQLPDRPATAAAGSAERPRRSPKTMALLAGLVLLVLCALATAGIVRAIRLANIPTPAGTPALPIPQPTSSPSPGETASPASSPTAGASTPTTTTQPTQPASLSDFPITGEIAIVQRSSGVERLLLLDAATGQSTTLPSVPDVDVRSVNAPQWSPDGQRLAWIAQYNGRSHVAVMDMTEQEPYQLPSGERYQRVSSPAFLPNGQQVSYYATGGEGTFLVLADVVTGEEDGKTPLNAYRNMFVWNWRTSQLAFVLPGASSYKVAVSDAPDGAERLVDTGGEGYSPAWSNDGQWLAFQSDLDRGAGLDEIWIARADGSDLHAVTSTPPEFWSRAPTWSPDGKMIAFVSNRSGSRGNDYGELFVVDIATGQTRQLTSTGGNVYDWRPAWRPR